MRPIRFVLAIRLWPGTLLTLMRTNVLNFRTHTMIIMHLSWGFFTVLFCFSPLAQLICILCFTLCFCCCCCSFIRVFPLACFYFPNQKQTKTTQQRFYCTYVCMRVWVYECVRVRCESHFNRFSCLFVFMLSLLAVASSSSSVSTCAQARRLKLAIAAQANKLFII